MCDPYTEVLNLNVPSCDLCSTKTDFDTSTSAICSNHQANNKFYDWTITQDATKQNTFTKFYVIMTLLNYDWADYSIISDNVAIFNGFFTPVFSTATGISVTFEVIADELPTPPVVSTVEIPVLLTLSAPMYSEVIADDNMNFVPTQLRLVDDATNEIFINIVSTTAVDLFTYYPDCGDLTQYQLNPSVPSCVECVVETTFLANQAVCEGSVDVKFFDWEVSNEHTTLRRERRIL
jgi:hypothetical protein